MTKPTLFHSLTFADAHAATEFLEAVGFERAAFHTDETGAVVHAQYTWRECGGVMFGSRRQDRADPGPEGLADSTGHGMCYCVVATDEEVDAVHDRAVAAGATSVLAPTDPEYGGRTCTLRDREGNQWSFGSYAGE